MFSGLAAPSCYSTLHGAHCFTIPLVIPSLPAMRSRTASLPSQPLARREALGSHGPTKRAGGRLIQDKARLVAFMHSALGCRVPDPRSSYDDHAASQPPPIRPMSPPLSHTD